MLRFGETLLNRSRGGHIGAGSGRQRLCNVFICIVLVCILAGSTAGLAQKGGRDQPPRPTQSTDPWPWVLAFILLGLAWYPAFKNSKRELER